MPKCAAPAGSLVADVLWRPGGAALGRGSRCRDSTAGGAAQDAAARRQPTPRPRSCRRPRSTARPTARAAGVCPLNFCGYTKSVATLGVTEPRRLAPTRSAARPRDLPGDAGGRVGRRAPALVPAAQAGGVGLRRRLLEGRRQHAALQGRLAVHRRRPAARGATFCTTLCRDRRATARPARPASSTPQPLPNSSYAMVGECTPASLIPGTICTRRAPARRGRAACSTARAPRCARARRAAAKSLGEACTAPAQCRSGECYDRNFSHRQRRQPRALLGRLRARTATAAPNQRCVVEVVGNNGTHRRPARRRRRRLLPQPVLGDDRVGLPEQQRLRDPGQGRRHLRPDATASATRRARSSAAPCASRRRLRPGADLRARADVRRAAPACCRAARPAGATGADVCPGATSTCSQRVSDEPLYRCYEGCATAGGCSRQADNYFCAPAQTGQPDQHLPLRGDLVMSRSRSLCFARMVAAQRCVLAPPAIGPSPPPTTPALPPRGRAQRRAAARITTAASCRPHWGIQARQLAGTPYPLALRRRIGACPDAERDARRSPVHDRHGRHRGALLEDPQPGAGTPAWRWRSAAASWGRRALDTYYGVGPIVGLTAAARQLAAPGGERQPRGQLSSTSSRRRRRRPAPQLVSVRAELEGELHFGFIGVPALSIGLTAGAAVPATRARPARATWSVGGHRRAAAFGARSRNLFVRYYL